jgi:hypothetical protein
VRSDKKRNDPNLDPVEDALQRCRWCLIVLTEGPGDPNIVGPFDSAGEAEIWSRSYPRSFVRLMASPEFESMLRRESEEIEAFKRRKN